MRTNIEIVEALINEARELTGSKTKKETIELALKEFIRIQKMKQLANLSGKVKWEGDLEQMRTYDKWEGNSHENKY